MAPFGKIVYRAFRSNQEYKPKADITAEWLVGTYC